MMTDGYGLSMVSTSLGAYNVLFIGFPKTHLHELATGQQRPRYIQPNSSNIAAGTGLSKTNRYAIRNQFPKHDMLFLMFYKVLEAFFFYRQLRKCPISLLMFTYCSVNLRCTGPHNHCTRPSNTADVPFEC